MMEPRLNQFKRGRDLSESLARNLQGGKWMTFTNQPLGSVLWDRPGIVDVLAVFRSYSNPCVRIYEVKIDHGDFLSDVNRGKYLNYMKNCNQLYFAAPVGVIKRNEVPEGCGLTTCSERGWRTAKAAPRREYEMSQALMMTLLLKGYQNHFEEYRRLEKERFENYKGLLEATCNFGIKVSHDIIRGFEYVEEAGKLKGEIEALAGEEFPLMGNAVYWLRREVDRLLGKRKFAEEAAQLMQQALRLFEGSAWGAEAKIREVADKLIGKTDGD